MKKLILLLCLLLVAIPCYATIVEVGGGTITTIDSITSGSIDSSGFSYTPVNKCYTIGSTLANTYNAVSPTALDKVVWTPASGKKIVLMGARFAASLATSIFVETGSTTIIPITDITASGVVVINSNCPIWQGAVNETLTFTGGVALARTSVLFWGYEK